MMRAIRENAWKKAKDTYLSTWRTLSFYERKRLAEVMLYCRRRNNEGK